jgi:hypothetical protein
LENGRKHFPKENGELTTSTKRKRVRSFFAVLRSNFFKLQSAKGKEGSAKSNQPNVKRQKLTHAESKGQPLFCAVFLLMRSLGSEPAQCNDRLSDLAHGGAQRHSERVSALVLFTVLTVGVCRLCVLNDGEGRKVGVCIVAALGPCDFQGIAIEAGSCVVSINSGVHVLCFYILSACSLANFAVSVKAPKEEIKGEDLISRKSIRNWQEAPNVSLLAVDVCVAQCNLLLSDVYGGARVASVPQARGSGAAIESRRETAAANRLC